MKRSKQILTGALGVCLAVALVLPSLLPVVSATYADDQEERMLGELSAYYESNGDPGCIGQVAGDPGGRSYGKYMFASNAGTPKMFFEWCQASDNSLYRSFGNRLSEAYYTGTPGYGPLFDAAWEELGYGETTRDAFGRCQRDFVRAQFYDRLLQEIADDVPAFDVANYSIALRNVLWSRAVQHGVGGAALVFQRAMDALGGFAGQSEAELINAIYEESGRVVDGSGQSNYMSGSDAQRYGVAGKALAYYTGCSGSIQLAVYVRLRVNEPAKAQAMLAQYGYGDAPLGEGSYFICCPGNDNLAVSGSGSTLRLDGRGQEDAQQFRLVYYASGYYTITNADNSLRLTGRAGSVTLEGPRSGGEQLWALERSSEGAGFALKNRATGQYLSATGYSAGGTLLCADAQVAWQLVPGAANWSLEGASYPTYANGLTVGASSYPFQGTLRSNYTITRVRSEIRNSGGTVLYYAEAKPNDTVYDLEQMDGAMAFSRLSGGSYTLAITADDSSGSHFELISPFFVSDGRYTVTFDPGQGTCSVKTLSYEPGQVLGDLPVATLAGHAFVGWFDEDGVQFTGASVTPARNMLLTARYAVQYRYTFYDYDGKTVLSSGALMEGQTIPTPKDPSRPATADVYYTFRGWSGFTPGMAMGKKDVSFTAVYDEHPVADLKEMAATGEYKLVEGYLRAIPAGTTAEEILATLTPREFITIRDSGGKAVTGAVGTGMTVEFAPAGTVTQRVPIVVTGDVNGDGSVTLTDMVQIRAHLLERSRLEGARFQAADLNGDGGVTLTDFVQTLSAVLGRTSIQPR